MSLVELPVTGDLLAILGDPIEQEALEHMQSGLEPRPPTDEMPYLDDEDGSQGPQGTGDTADWMRRQLDHDIAAIAWRHIRTSGIDENAALNVDRERALLYYQGHMRDMPVKKGRSAVVSRDVADTIGWIMPSLMRVFMSSDQVVVFDPDNMQSEQAAKDATDYLNDLFIKDLDGYRVLWDAFHDALLLRNGIVKHYFDNTPEYEYRQFEQLPTEALVQILSDESVEVIEHDQYEIQHPQAGKVTVHDVRVRVKVSDGKICVDVIPPEDYLRYDMEDTPFEGHRMLKTRSELIEMGYDKRMIDSLPTHSLSQYHGVKQARNQRSARHMDNTMRYEASDEATELVEIYECYFSMDIAGDGVAEPIRAVVGGGDGGQHTLDWERWDEEDAFTDLTPEPVPHRWQGRSIFDDTEDIQRIKTALMRGYLDNLYQVNNWSKEVDVARLDDTMAAQSLAQLRNPEIGGTVFARGGKAVTPLETPYIGPAALEGLNYMDEVNAKRTGVSRQSTALDAEALSNQSATAAMLSQQTSYSKLELIARNFAEMGLRKLFRNLLKLVTRHHQDVVTRKIRGQFREFNPSAWQADGFSVTVNTGLGSGSRERDLQALMVTRQNQMQYLTLLGMSNPVVGLEEIRDVDAKIAESAGLKNTEQYFKEIDPQAMRRFAQQQEQRRQQGDPQEQREMQAELQKEQIKAQADVQSDRIKAQADVEAERAKASQRAATEIRLQQIKSTADLEMEVRKLEIEFQYKREQLQRELAMKREIAEMEARLDQKVQTDISPGGQPG